MAFFIAWKVILLIISASLIESAGRCPPNEFTCGDGTCIEKEFLCDGSRECNDGSDETSDLCAHRRCGDFAGSVSLFSFDESVSYFRCSYGGCISDNFICDGLTNCFDGSDETTALCQNKRCKRREFQCGYGACLSLRLKCNGRYNCKDGSDETQQLCSNHRKCSKRQFKCDYGACIYGRRKCNGHADCVDASDESEALCGVNTVVVPPQLPSFSEPSTITPPKTTNAPSTEKATTRKTTSVTKPPIIKPIKINSNLASIFEAFDLFKKLGIDDKVAYKEDGVNIDLSSLAGGIIPELSDILDESKKPIVQPTLNTSPRPIVTISSESPEITTVGDSCSGVNQCSCVVFSKVICIPCDTKTTVEDSCRPIQRPDLCLKFVDDGIYFDVIHCGHSTKNLTSCGTESGLPLSTQVLVSCWDLPPSPLECRFDGRWHPIDYAGSDKGMQELCQPSILNSNICGRLPPVKRIAPTRGIDGKLTMPSIKLKFDWPWIVGITNKGKFICTGTLITNRWIISAAHCITRSFDRRNKEENIHGFEIEYLAFNGEVGVMNISSWKINPEYVGGSHPKNDVALFKLNETLFLSKHLIPACLDSKEDLLRKKALTFNRPEGSKDFHWELFSQSLDLSCLNRERHCSRHVQIDHDQFCGTNKESGKHLYPGSSGGPYLINEGKDSNDKWTVSGVLSSLITTSGCPHHTVFSNVSMHIDWISTCIQDQTC